MLGEKAEKWFKWYLFFGDYEDRYGTPRIHSDDQFRRENWVVERLRLAIEDASDREELIAGVRRLCESHENLWELERLAEVLGRLESPGAEGAIESIAARLDMAGKHDWAARARRTSSDWGA